MGKKKITATIDEVNDAKAQVEAQIEATKQQVESSFKTQLAELEEKIREEVKKVQANVDHLDEVKIEEPRASAVAEAAKGDLEATAASIRQEVEALRPIIADSVLRTRKELEQLVEQTDGNTRSTFAEELETLCSKFDEELTALRTDTQAQMSERAAAAAAALEKDRQEVDAIIEQRRQEAAAACEELRQHAAEELLRAREAQEKTDKKQDQKAKSTQQDNEYKFEQIEADINKRADEAAFALKKHAEYAAEQLAAEHKRVVGRFDDCNEEFNRIQACFNDVENVPTRKVEWIVREAGNRLKAPTKPKEGEEELPPYGSWFSPKFDAAGARGLQLEFRSFRQPEPPAEPDDEERKGDCIALLHAPQGTHIAFKLSIAKASETFEHKFDGEDPCPSKRLCFLQENLSSTGTITIGVEILECIYQFDKKLAVPPQEELESEEYDERACGSGLEASFRLQRHTNNRILDMVKVQMDYFKKRMTRRIEWRLEQASKMRKAFPKGVPMRSKEFDAAGVDGMQIHFYPSGYDSAYEGYSSAFLSVPAGASVRCSLTVGTETREINHTFDKPGQLGKANFCRWESCVSPEDDCVLIQLEIHEAHVDLVAKASHPPPVAVGMRSFVKEATPLVPLGSTVKLQRVADSLPPILQEVKMLPSLWAGRNLHEVAVKVENGLRPLKDVRKGRPRSGGGHHRRSPSSPLLH
mmetsp:Transcript_51499/g.130111  ORF Transcript_51499/g.130111 Transcript_51499/m.130111 type:complete len:698 (+) Transcript_51499:103-2196(+)